MNTQEAHLAIVEHFSKPGAKLSYMMGPDKAGNPRVYCRYRLNGRADDPTRCGVGVLIPDDKYDPAWDTGTANASITVLLEKDPQIFGDTLNGIRMDYLGCVQIAHDDAATNESLSEEEKVVEFLAAMDNIAGEFDIQLVPDFPPAAVEEVRDKELVPA